MPIFEYKCQTCEEEFEKLVSGTNVEISCPKCGSRDVKKKFSVFGMSGVEKQISSCSSCNATSCGSCN
ncbi:MAG: zinc ribbon domain-containing protein [Nitrospirae bacterium]|nr:zinc ribbon domain-containing protein [Nitrospirota bacterium]